MPQPPVGLNVRATGELGVTRTCAIDGCDETISAPARFCNDHWQATPLQLRESHMKAQTDRIEHPTVRAIVDHWKRQ